MDRATPRFGEDVAQRRAEGGGVPVGDDDPGPARQQLDGVGERGRHDGPAGGEGVDEHARGDLVLRVVRQDDDRGVLYQTGQRGQVPVGGIEGDRRGHPLAQVRATSISR